MEYAPVTSATAEGFMMKSLETPRAKTTSDASSAIQMLEELVRKYEEHRDKKYDKDLKLQRLYYKLPKPNEQQLVLEDRDRSATHESVKRRANSWIWGLVTGLDGTERRKGKIRKRTVQWILLPVRTEEDTQQRIASRQRQSVTTVDSVDQGQSRALKRE